MHYSRQYEAGTDSASNLNLRIGLPQIILDERDETELSPQIGENALRSRGSPLPYDLDRDSSAGRT